MSCWANGKDYETLQEAIDSLPALGGDVMVNAGHYEDLTITKPKSELTVHFRVGWWRWLSRWFQTRILRREARITIMGRGRRMERPTFWVDEEGDDDE